MFIDQHISDEEVKKLLIDMSLCDKNFPISINEDTKVKRFCEGGQSLALNIDNEYVVRMPKFQQTLDELNKETKITKYCANYVKRTNISNVSLYQGGMYPFAYHKSINGKTMDMEERENNVHYAQLSLRQQSLLAADLASFLFELHQVPIDKKDIIQDHRMDYFQEKHFLRSKIILLKYGINLSDYIPQNEDVVCCHNDLHGRNIAIDESKEHVLQGVFDFGVCGCNKRSADFVKLYTIDRELGRKTIEEYNKLSSNKVNIKNVDGQFLAWCAINLQMAEKLLEPNRGKIIESMEKYITHFKNDEYKVQKENNQKFSKINKLQKLRGVMPSQNETLSLNNINIKDISFRIKNERD